jgi:hypothetical protein
MDKLIKQIQSDDIDLIYQRVTDTATVWAVSGFIEEANRLLEKLWSLKIEHTGNTWLNDEGFQFLWTITGKKPDYIPFQLQDLNTMQAENWRDMFWPFSQVTADTHTLYKGINYKDSIHMIYQLIYQGKLLPLRKELNFKFYKLN